MKQVLAPIQRKLAAAFGWLTSPSERGPLASVLVTLCFGVVLSFAHYHHEPWRDEIHCWALGKNALGFSDLAFGTRRYDGHPLLWYYLLHVVSRVIPGPFGLHFTGVVIAASSTYLWFRYSGFPRYLRLLLLPTYFFFYEYGVITRSYGLGILLMFAFCTVYQRERPRYVTLSALLVLLALTSLYGAIISMVLGLFLFTPRLVPSPQGQAFTMALRGDRRVMLAGVAVLLVGALFVARTSFPPKDAVYAPTWQTSFGLENLLAVLRRYWLALLPTSPDWWSSQSLGSQVAWFTPWLPRAAALLLVALLVSFWRAPVLVASYALGVALMGLFQELKYPGGMRHIGHFFILLVTCGWLLNRERARQRHSLLLVSLLTLVFAVQALGGWRSTLADVSRPFSTAREAADYLRPRLTREHVVIGAMDGVAAPVAQFLDRAFLFADTGDFIKSIVWHNRRVGVDATRLFTLAAEQIKDNHPVYFVLSFPLSVREHAGLRAVQRHTVKAGIVADESYFIYEVRVSER